MKKFIQRMIPTFSGDTLFEMSFKFIHILNTYKTLNRARKHCHTFQYSLIIESPFIQNVSHGHHLIRCRPLVFWIVDIT